MNKKDAVPSTPEEIIVGQNKFRSIVEENGGFRNNERLHMDLSAGVSTFELKVGDEVVCYVYKK